MERLKEREKAEEEEEAEAGTIEPPQPLGADVTRRARGGGDVEEGIENLDGVDKHNNGKFENQKIPNETETMKIDSENIDKILQATYTNTGNIESSDISQ